MRLIAIQIQLSPDDIARLDAAVAEQKYNRSRGAFCRKVVLAELERLEASKTQQSDERQAIAV